MSTTKNSRPSSSPPTEDGSSSTTATIGSSIASSSTPEATKAPKVPSDTPALSWDEYLSRGYYLGEGAARYIDPDLVGETAQRLAQDLATGGMKQTATNSILRELKRADKKTLPLDAKQGALSGAIVTAKQLQQRHRAPGLLVDILERNRAAVESDADYKAAVKHLTAVGVYLGDYQE